MQMEDIIVDCDCYSLDHVMRFSYDQEDGLVYIGARLSTHKNWYQRLWAAVKYVFTPGKTCFGHYDEVIVKVKHYDPIIELMTKAKDHANKVSSG